MSRRPGAALRTGGVVVLAALALLPGRPAPPPPSPAELETGVVEAAARLAATATAALAATASDAPGGPVADFDRLASLGTGGVAVSLLRGGRVAAWTGSPGAIEASPALGASIAGSPPPVRLRFAAAAGERMAVAEQPLSGALRGLSIERVVAHDPGRLARLDRAGGAGSPSRVMLRDGEGRPFAAVEVRFPAGASPARRPHPLAVTAALALAALAAAGALRAGGEPASFRSLAFAMAGAALFRAALHAPALRAASPLHSPESFALAAPAGLLASPGDFLASGLAALLAGQALARAVGWPAAGAIRRQRSPRRAMALALVAAAIAWVFCETVAGVVERAAHNTQLDLRAFSVVSLQPERLAIQLGLLCGLLAGTLPLAAILARALGYVPAGPARLALALVWTAAGLAAAARGGHSAPLWPYLAVLTAGLVAAAARPALPARVFATAAVAGATLGVVLFGATREALARFVSRDLRAALLGHEERLREALGQTLEGLSGRQGERLIGRRAEDLAWEVWRTSSLRRAGYRAAIEVDTPGGEAATFAERLSLPAELRPVAPGSITHQEAVFQGRRHALLAGAARLEDGTRITIRAASDYESLPWFSGFEPRAAAGVPAGEAPAWLRAAGLTLTVTDASGRPLGPPGPGSVRVDPARAAGASSQPRWWRTRNERGPVDAATFAIAGRVVTLALPRPAPDERAATVLAAALTGILAAAAGWLVVLPVLPAARAALPDRDAVATSFRRRLLLGVIVVGAVPLLGAAVYLRSAVERERSEARRARALAAAELARRLFVEVGAAGGGHGLDDAGLIWLSATVGGELAWYRDGELRATSMRSELREGRLGLRPPAPAWREVVLGGAPAHLESVAGEAGLAVVVSLPVGPDGLLALHARAGQPDPAGPGGGGERTLFLAAVGLVAVWLVLAPVLARRATRPVVELIDGVRRVASGDLSVRLAPRRRDETGVLVEAFNAMAEELARGRSRLEAQGAWLALLLENATTGILSVDAAGRVRAANPAARTLLEAPLAPGDPAHTALAGAGREALVAALSAPAGSPRTELELRLGPPPAERVLRAVLVPLPAGAEGTGGRLALIDDVTGIVRAKKLEAWAEMARRVAHEIKNPLTPIQLAAEHARRVAAGGGEAAAAVLERCLATILRQVQELRSIVREFSAYGSPPRRVEKVATDVGEWLAATIAPYREAPPAGVEIAVECAPGLRHAFDAQMLRRAVVNLVDNALQAMPAGGRLGVRAWREADGSLAIAVADTGVGFPAELVPRVFEPYFSTRDAGTGLGLANCRRAVEEHGGRVELHSVEGRGATFTIRLPAADGGPDAPAGQDRQFTAPR